MSEDIRKVMRRHWEHVWPEADVAGLAETVHPDCVNHEAPPGAPQGFEGVKQTMLWLAGVFSEQRYEIQQMVAEGDTVAVRLIHSGVHTGELMGLPPTGRRFAYPHMHIVRFADGLGVEHWAVRDDATLMRQLTAAV